VGVSTRAPSREEALEVVEHFATGGPVLDLRPHTSGLINFSWAVRVEGPPGPRLLLLQQINRFVFRRPHEVMENMRRVTGHVAAAVAGEGAPEPERRVLTLVPTRQGEWSHLDPRGETWRLLVWIERTHSRERAQTEEQAFETARAFGGFVRQLSTLPGPPLFATIPGFHDTPARLAALEGAARHDGAGRASACGEVIDDLMGRRSLAEVLDRAVRRGALAERAVHNDAKIANVLFDDATGEALCVVDLDTVMPGLAPHDFGDLVRSTVSDSAEDEKDLDRVVARPSFYEALFRGFTEGARGALSPLERSLLLDGARVIVYEQALRFLTDHLQGDPYYRIDRPGHNLDRARAQARLLASLEAVAPGLGSSAWT
jgi:Ser/Thr protein kinase RdoA (MazF antagonist)